MTGWAELDRLLQTDPADVGCEQALHILHVYVDLVLDEVEAVEGIDPAGAHLAGMTTSAAEHRYPGVAAHLRACDPCAEDYRGLLLAAQANRA